MRHTPDESVARDPAVCCRSPAACESAAQAQCCQRHDDALQVRLGEGGVGRRVGLLSRGPYMASLARKACPRQASRADAMKLHEWRCTDRQLCRSCVAALSLPQIYLCLLHMRAPLLPPFSPALRLDAIRVAAGAFPAPAASPGWVPLQTSDLDSPKIAPPRRCQSRFCCFTFSGRCGATFVASSSASSCSQATWSPVHSPRTPAMAGAA